MLKKLLFQNQDKKQLIIAMIGSFLGITFLITSIHYLIRVQEFGKGSEVLGPNIVIAQKMVDAKSLLRMAKTDFSEKEIQNIKNEKFVEDVQPIYSNNFDIRFETNDDRVPVFKTDVFVQTIDEKFLDVKLDNWSWKPGDEYVPMILPREFVVMLNTFMSAQGIPQISDEMAMAVKFQFRLKNDEKTEYVQAKLVGFTNEVSAILIPKEFMDYGNTAFASGSEQKITQILIQGKESEFGSVEKLINERGLETRNSQMIVGRLKSIVGTLFAVVLGISVIAVFLAGLVLIQYLQLLISRNSYQVQTLIRLGYPPRQIIRLFFTYFVKVFAVVAGVGIGSFMLLKYFLDAMFEQGGLYIDTQISWISLGVLLLAFALFSLASFRTSQKGINQVA